MGALARVAQVDSALTAARKPCSHVSLAAKLAAAKAVNVMVRDLHDRQALLRRNKAKGRTSGQEEDSSDEEERFSPAGEKQGRGEFAKGARDGRGDRREADADARAEFMRIKYKFAVATPSGP